jgi:hypothetical protein
MFASMMYCFVSNHTPWHPTKNLAYSSQAKEHKVVFVTFGGLAVMIPREGC